MADSKPAGRGLFLTKTSSSEPKPGVSNSQQQVVANMKGHDGDDDSDSQAYSDDEDEDEDDSSPIGNGATAQGQQQTQQPLTADEKRRLEIRKQIEIDDLGLDRRHYVTSHDAAVPLELRLSKDQLLQGRRINQKGTAAALLAGKNKASLHAWNNAKHLMEDKSSIREEQPDIMGGQSHRSRLARDVQVAGGQRYGQPSAPPKPTKRARLTPVSTYGTLSPELSAPSGPRGRQGTVVRGSPSARGIGARSGRGAPMCFGKGDRPSDPAVDTDRPYGYKDKRKKSNAASIAQHGHPPRGMPPVPPIPARQPTRNLDDNHKHLDNNAFLAAMKSIPRKLPQNQVAKDFKSQLQNLMLDDKANTKKPQDGPILHAQRDELTARPVGTKPESKANSMATAYTAGMRTVSTYNSSDFVDTMPSRPSGGLARGIVEKNGNISNKAEVAASVRSYGDVDDVFAPNAARGNGVRKPEVAKVADPKKVAKTPSPRIKFKNRKYVRADLFPESVLLQYVGQMTPPKDEEEKNVEAGFGREARAQEVSQTPVITKKVPIAVPLPSVRPNTLLGEHNLPGRPSPPASSASIKYSDLARGTDDSLPKGSYFSLTKVPITRKAPSQASSQPPAQARSLPQFEYQTTKSKEGQSHVNQNGGMAANRKPGPRKVESAPKEVREKGRLTPPDQSPQLLLSMDTPPSQRFQALTKREAEHSPAAGKAKGGNTSDTEMLGVDFTRPQTQNTSGGIKDKESPGQTACGVVEPKIVSPQFPNPLAAEFKSGQSVVKGLAISKPGAQTTANLSHQNGEKAASNEPMDIIMKDSVLESKEPDKLTSSILKPLTPVKQAAPQKGSNPFSKFTRPGGSIWASNDSNTDVLARVERAKFIEHVKSLDHSESVGRSIGRSVVGHSNKSSLNQEIEPSFQHQMELVETKKTAPPRRQSTAPLPSKGLESSIWALPGDEGPAQPRVSKSTTPGPTASVTPKRHENSIDRMAPGTAQRGTPIRVRGDLRESAINLLALSSSQVGLQTPNKVVAPRVKPQPTQHVNTPAHSSRSQREREFKLGSMMWKSDGDSDGEV